MSKKTPVITPPKAKNQIYAVEAFQGPIPHPELLERYDNIVPGAANRIISMAEENHHFRIEQTKLDGEREFLLTISGQICGILVVVIFAAAAVFLALHDKTIPAAISAGAPLLGLVTVFIKGRNFSKK